MTPKSPEGQIFLFAMTLAVLVWLAAADASPSPGRTPAPAATVAPTGRMSGPRSIILFIGDGMAAPQLYAARVFKGLDLNVRVARLHIDSLPVLGTFDNHSADELVTDSAAAATEMATGVRVSNKVLSIDTGGKPLPTILEHAHEQGRATGLVTTVTVSNATPAAFAAHIVERSEEYDIAAQYVDRRAVDILLGGGRANFLPPGVNGGQRPDARNLSTELQDKGYTYVTDREALLADRGSPRLLGLFDVGAMAYEIDRDRVRQPSLAEMTSAALRGLSKKSKGFFLMVEGGKIDWAGHSNDLATVVVETLALDEAVGVGLEFQKTHADVLLLVTGDHETGGLTFPANFDLTPLKLQHASVEHTLESLPLQALDPNEERFTNAVRDNLSLTLDVPMREKLKLAQKSPKEMLYLLTSALTARTRASFSTVTHSGLPPLLAARGPGQWRFSGSYDITDVYAKMAKLFGIVPPRP